MNDLTSRAGRALDGALWLIILGGVLGLSSYSFYDIARHMGYPPVFAAALITVFDGVVIFMARYSVHYLERRMNPFAPRILVIIFTCLAAYAQLHSPLSGFPGSKIILMAMPFSAMLVYEIHLRCAKRDTYRRAGVLCAEPESELGAKAWITHPVIAYHEFRACGADHLAVVSAQREARTEARKTVQPIQAAAEQRPRVRLHSVPAPGKKSPARVRAWAKRQGYDIGDRARIPGYIWEEYDKAMKAAS